MTTDADLRRIIAGTKTIAVLGIKPESHSAQPAHSVPAYMQSRGFEIIPVPVYYPEVTTILGRPVYRTLAAAAADMPIDMVNVFRRPSDIPPHLEDILAAHPKVVWMQLGISNEGVAAKLRAAGIEVVQDRCLLVDHRRLA